MKTLAALKVTKKGHFEYGLPVRVLMPCMWVETGNLGQVVQSKMSDTIILIET